jgi:hypothetical protein
MSIGMASAFTGKSSKFKGDTGRAHNNLLLNMRERARVIKERRKMLSGKQFEGVEVKAVAPKAGKRKLKTAVVSLAITGMLASGCISEKNYARYDFPNGEHEYYMKVAVENNPELWNGIMRNFAELDSMGMERNAMARNLESMSGAVEQMETQIRIGRELGREEIRALQAGKDSVSAKRNAFSRLIAAIEEKTAELKGKLKEMKGKSFASESWSDGKPSDYGLVDSKAGWGNFIFGVLGVMAVYLSIGPLVDVYTYLEESWKRGTFRRQTHR